MTLRSRTPGVALACAALLMLGACGGRGGDSPSANSTSPADGATAAPAGEVFEYKIDNAAQAPAPPTPGATTGGTVRVYTVTDAQHLDPARIYSADESTVSLLFTRSLTGYRQAGTTTTLVGDLATDTGRTTDGGKTWEYTLRDGVTWEDGKAITAADVKYGLERTFVKDYAEGPTFIQRWLTGKSDYHSVYTGPYDGKSYDGISTPDDKTIRLSFPEPQPDLPFAMAMPFSSPVRKDKDTRATYDQFPFATGPYRIADRKLDKSMTLVRNPNWKPESDPIRTNYPDRWEFSYGEIPLNTNQRLIAAVGGDAAAMTFVGVSPEVLPKVLSTPDLVNRTVSGIGPTVFYVAINNKRISDVRIRKALMYAWPRNQIRQLLGGPDTGEFAHTLTSPTLVGHESFDLFNVPPEGDPEKSKALLAEAGVQGKQKVVYAYGNLPRGEQIAVLVVQALEKAGFEVVKKPLNPKSAQEETSDPTNQFDLYGSGWLADWPSGYTVLPPLFDGREIRRGGYNTSFYNDPAVSAEMDEIAKIVDPIEAGKRWSALDKKIMEQVPVIPDLYDRSRHLYGPKIGGATLSTVLSLVSFMGVYVKP